MSELAESFQISRTAIENLTLELVKEFMANRVEQKGNQKEWSDLVIRVDSREGHMRVEWRRRVWSNRRGKQSKRGYLSKYLSDRNVLRYAKDFEYDEVKLVKERLQELKQQHSESFKAENRMVRLGLTLDADDRKAGFMPDDLQEKRDSKGRYAAA